MSSLFQDALICGVERVTAWADLLDRLNVYPVPDQDTGSNLVVTLTVLRNQSLDAPGLVQQVQLNASGNSGNIAAQFLSGFLQADQSLDLLQAVCLGNKRAWEAIEDPKPGTMLTLFDSFEQTGKVLGRIEKSNYPVYCSALEDSVRLTNSLLPELSQAGVVDSGALGMFVFFEGFFHRFFSLGYQLVPVTEKFRDHTKPDSPTEDQKGLGHCIQGVLDMSNNIDYTRQQAGRELGPLGESLVIARQDDLLKFHLHSQNPQAVKEQAQSLGSILQWSVNDMKDQNRQFAGSIGDGPRIVTDAAGSITREDARNFGLSLMDSYILIDHTAFPETRLDRERLYQDMHAGKKVKTSQASFQERQEQLLSAAGQYKNIIYICVGSFYTGNFEIAHKWVQENDLSDRIKIVDSGTASGRLGISVLKLARMAVDIDDLLELEAVARKILASAEEYIFLDRLKYLAAGGRIAKTNAVFGDMLKLKPVITPTSQGAQKIALLRKNEDQLEFALEKLSTAAKSSRLSMLMLEYTDNYEWISSIVCTRIKKIAPHVETIIRPMSLTAGVHMGPGTWGMAFL